MTMNTKLGSEACGFRPAMLFTLAYKREKLNYQRTTLATCRISLENPNNVLGFFESTQKNLNSPMWPLDFYNLKDKDHVCAFL